MKTENRGGSCNYYKVSVNKPTSLLNPYEVECNDLIESLGLTFAEANIYKEIFRTANERTHNNGKNGNTPLRAAEKVLFFAMRQAIANGVDVRKMFDEMNIPTAQISGDYQNSPDGNVPVPVTGLTEDDLK